MFFGPKPIFQLGETASGLAGSSTAVSDTLVPANWEGQVWSHAHALANSTDWVTVTGGVLTGSNKPKWGHNSRLCIAVRNTHASVTAKAKLVRKFYTAGTDANPHYALSRTADVATTVGEVALPADECLPSTGASPNDLFWCVYSGLATVNKTAATIAQGEFVIPTTAGEVITQDITVAAGSATFNQAQGAIGRAAHGQTTETRIVIHVGRWP